MWREGNGLCGASEREGMGWLWLRVLGWAEEGKRKGPAGKEGLGWAKPFHGLDWVLESSSFLFLF